MNPLSNLDILRWPVVTPSSRKEVPFCAETRYQERPAVNVVTFLLSQACNLQFFCPAQFLLSTYIRYRGSRKCERAKLVGDGISP